MGERPRILRIPQFWTSPQRGVLLAFTLILSLFLLYRALTNRQYVSDPQPAKSARFDELADRLDPNVATWQELAVLPQLGEKRAKEIVAARESWREIDPSRVVFRRAEDLLAVRGIGVAMIETLRPYLMFPASTRSTTSVTTRSVATAATPRREPASRPARVTVPHHAAPAVLDENFGQPER